MASRYTSSTNIRCWKRHTCVSCGGEFSYLFVRKVTGTARTAAGATIAAEKNVKKTLADDVDSQPCPTCGIFQPDMIGQRRAKRQKWLFAISVAALIVLLALSGSHVLQDDSFVPAAAATLAAIGLAQFFADAGRPNRDPAANKQLALVALEGGTLRVDKPGTIADSLAEPWQPKSSMLRPAAYFLAVTGLLAVLAPSVIRSSQGWPFNSGSYPPVVGPGDSTCFYMRQSIKSLKGYFRGMVRATARPADGGPQFALAAKSSDADWGQTIQAKASEKSQNVRLWVTLFIPDKADLAGKTINCDLNLAAQFPVTDPTGSHFNIVHQEFQDSLTLELGPPHSGGAYRQAWWFGVIGGMTSFLIGGLLRISDARRLRKQGLPTSVMTVADVGQAGRAQSQN